LKDGHRHISLYVNFQAVLEFDGCQLVVWISGWNASHRFQRKTTRLFGCYISRLL